MWSRKIDRPFDTLGCEEKPHSAHEITVVNPGYVLPTSGYGAA